MPRYQRVPNHPGAPDLERLRAALDAARHPFLLLGGSGWTARAVERIAAFAQAFELPVGTAWRRLECFDQRHPNAAGQVGWGMTDALRAPRGRRPDPGRGHAAGRGHHRRLSAAGRPRRRSG